MLTQNMNGVIAVRLDRGEEIVASLEQICEQYDIGAAKIDGLGAVRDTTVAMFDFTKKQYHETVAAAMEFYGRHRQRQRDRDDAR